MLNIHGSRINFYTPTLNSIDQPDWEWYNFYIHPALHLTFNRMRERKKNIHSLSLISFRLCIFLDTIFLMRIAKIQNGFVFPLLFLCICHKTERFVCVLPYVSTLTSLWKRHNHFRFASKLRLTIYTIYTLLHSNEETK